MADPVGGYKSALRFILSREMFGMKLGLENIGAFLARLENPQERFRSIHIAGTNGKGSTAAYLDAILRQAGYKTGLFTSPHLVDFRERIKIDGRKIEESYVTRFIQDHKRQIARQKITFFELCTALAFQYFADRKVDIAVIETGLGGRLDATNTLRPIISVITDISFDHTTILGDTLAKIAAEKAGIIKENVPVVTGLLPGEAGKAIRTAARQHDAPLIVLSRGDFKKTGKGFAFNFRDDKADLTGLESSLPGEHQIINAALAVKVCGELQQHGYKTKPRDIRQGLKETDWPGRFQIMREPGQPVVILDVGHNPAGAAAIAAGMRKSFPGRRADMIIGLVNTKDLDGVIRPLASVVRSALVAPLKTHRTADPSDIVALFWKYGVPAETSSSIKAAARKMIKSAGSDDIIIVCGSHYGVGEYISNREWIHGGKKKRF